MSKLDFLKNNAIQETKQHNEEDIASLQTQINTLQKRIEQVEEDFEVLAQHIVQIGQIVGYIKNPRDKDKGQK